MVPKMKEKTQKSAKNNCRKLYKMTVPPGGNYFFVIDDETYMELNPEDSNKKQYVSIIPDHPLSVADQVTQKTKFPPMMLIWQAIAKTVAFRQPTLLMVL